MKAFASLLAVLLMMSCTSLAQTAPVQQAGPEQQTGLAQQAAAAQQAAQADKAAAAPVQQTVADASKPGAAGLTDGLASTASAPAGSTASAEESAASAADVPALPAVSFGPGVKLFIEPMDGFGELLTEAITKKKVPVVLVEKREQADFIMTGDAHVKKPGWLMGNFVYLHGQANISIDDAHSGTTVFAFTAKRVDANLLDGEVYAIWAGGCANHLKKALRKK